MFFFFLRAAVIKAEEGETLKVLTCQFAPIISCHNHNPVPLDGDGHGCAGQVSNVSNGDDQNVACCLQ